MKGPSTRRELFDRSDVLRIRLTPAQRDAVTAMAISEGISLAGVVRQAIDRHIVRAFRTQEGRPR